MKSLRSTLLSSLVKLFRPCLVVLFGAALSACNALGLQQPWDDDQTPDYALVSQNLVDSIAQFPHLNPLMATVQVSKPESTFARYVQQELSDRGYKLQPALDGVADGGGAADGGGENNLVNARTTQVVRAGVGKQNLYVLAVGSVSVERAYDTVAGKTVPVSELVVRGTEEQNVELNDDIFEVPDSPFSTVAYKPADVSGIKKNYSKLDTSVATEVEPTVSPAMPAPQAKRIATPSGNAIKHNMYENMLSNYEDVFEDYEEIDRKTLIFPNDSLRIGDSNKDIIEHFASRMDPETDVLSVIGCSHGNTEYENGNSLLALGRANRVKESFMFLGMEHDKVLEEGCWAPVVFDQMPKRGVVVTLKRRKPS